MKIDRLVIVSNLRRALPGVQHGPTVWPWWRRFALAFVRLSVEHPSSGFRLWIYTRAGGRSIDLYVDRRVEAHT